MEAASDDFSRPPLSVLQYYVLAVVRESVTSLTFHGQTSFNVH